MISKSVLLLFLATFFLASISAKAQQTPIPIEKRISISGKIRDQHGAFVPGAKVIASWTAGDFATTTDDKGDYQLNLFAGKYEISVVSGGLKTYRVTREVIPQGPKGTFDFMLDVSFDHEPCGYGGDQCFNDLIPEGIKTSPPAVDTTIQSRPAPTKPEVYDDEINLPDNVMKQLVKQIITWYFKPSPMRRTVYLADRFLKREWLPKIGGKHDEAVTAAASGQSPASA